MPSLGQQLPAQLWVSTSPLLLIVFEGRVPFSTSRLYQPQLWNPRFVLDTILLQEGKQRDAVWMWGALYRITRERNVTVVNGFVFTPNGPQGVEDIGLCNLSIVKVPYFWGEVRKVLTMETIKQWFCDGRVSWIIVFYRTSGSCHNLYKLTWRGTLLLKMSTKWLSIWEIWGFFMTEACQWRSGEKVVSSCASHHVGDAALQWCIVITFHSLIPQLYYHLSLS